MLCQNLKKEGIILLRRPLNFAVGTIVLFAMFWGINSGFKGVDNESFYISYIVWLVMSTNFTNLISFFSTESITGTLEHLVANSYSILHLLLSKCITVFIIYSSQILTVILLMMVLETNSSIGIDVLYIFPISLLGISSIWGLALILGSLVIKFKNISTLISICSTILFFLTTYSNKFNDIILFLIPFGHANAMIKSLLDKTTEESISTGSIIFAIFNGLFYFLIGYICLLLSIKAAKNSGKLGY